MKRILLLIVLDLINRLKPWINQPNFRWETAISLEFLPGTIIKDTQLMDGILISKDPVIESQLQSRGLINPRISSSAFKNSIMNSHKRKIKTKKMITYKWKYN